MIRRTVLILIALIARPSSAEQFKAFDDIEVHYVVVNTLFLEPDVAERYGVVRAKDRAIVNLSVLGAGGKAISADVAGVAVNLLSQEAQLAFSTIREGDSIYYIAPIRYTDQDVLRFRIAVKVPDREPMNVEFQQLMYVAP
jgi:hypothetical protein